MECKGIKNQLSDYIDGQLSEAAAEDVAHHLESCPDCKQAHEDMTRLVGFMREIDTVDEPADLLQNVRSRLESKPPVWDRIRELLSTPAFRVPAAATVLAAVLLFVLYVPGEREIPLMSPAPVMEEKSADGFFDREVTLEQEKKGPARQKRDDEVDELVDVAGEAEVTHERGGREEEVPTTVIEGDELKEGRRENEAEPAAPKSEEGTLSRVQDAPAAAKASPVTPPGSRPEMPSEVALGADTAFITLNTSEDADVGMASTYAKKMSQTVAEETSRDRLTEEVTGEQRFVVLAVDSVGGEVIEWVYDDERRLSAVMAEIPADRFDEFQKMLGKWGEVSDVKLPQSVAKDKSAAKEDPASDKKPVTVRIRIRR
jgi:negative regulator of sigma E activity